MKTYCIIFLLIIFGCKSETQKKAEKPYTLKIAYNVLYDGDNDDYEVFSMDLDGKNKKNLTNFKGVEWTYYAHDDDLYFITDKDTAHRNYQLYKMKADGSSKTKISDIRLNDSWHSTRNNGSEIIVRPHNSIDTAFYVLSNTGKILNKIKPDLKYLSDPTYSPDGTQIVFRGAHKPFKKDQGYIDELYLINADGSHLKQLTHYPKADTTANWYSYHAGPPKWHPTEKFISYGSFQNGKYSLYAITTDGKKQWKLLLETKTSSSIWHDWSPDGKWLVYGFSNDDKPPYHIELMNWETKETKVLTEDSEYQYHQAPVFVKVYE
ncbi:DUF5050 domain-containing protein [Sabulilitoribacter multivorans]|uniref:DUF5050 domain-containing protein n=1 Tax=Flaviramulus multivorans TaxID=1304750 RepID=A0ABS9IKT8_9FLAO|nr:DUF5050 domain-containing protein [Flaviramulus multivorans]MCF7561229.1 DUF5050 domain-containing protein [Flaviramulus multivorans]